MPKREEDMAAPDQGASRTAGGPVDGELESLDARVRIKLAQGLPLTPEERALFARLPGSRELPPDVVQRGEADVDHQ